MDTNEPQFSVIITTYDQANELKEGLPVFLTQEYNPGYEVVVVDESSTDDTDDVLKLLKQDYAHLYSTFLPRPNRLVNRPKLAYNVGIKAAKYEWIILTDINRKPDNPNMLQIISKAMDGNMAVIYFGYLGKKGIRLQPFNHLHEASRLLIKGEQGKGSNHPEKRMKYIRGRYDFIIIRKDQAQEALRFFERRVSYSQLLRLRIGIFWQNLCKRSSTTLLVQE